VGHVWTPGLTTGEVTLWGIIPGDDVRPGEVLLVDVNGRIGRLEDKPAPGIYFQVLSSLEGEDAANYYIESSGNVPGIMTIHRAWVMWRTYDAIYTPDWGFLSYHPYTGELGQGLGADLWLGNERIFAPVRLGLYYYTWETSYLSPEYLPRVEPWAVQRYPGRYYIVVEWFDGSAADYFIPFPATEDTDQMGTLVAFADNSLGMTLIGGVDDPLKGRIASVTQLQQEEWEELSALQESSGVEVQLLNFGLNYDLSRGDGPVSWTLFGANVDYETALSSDATASAYAGVLAAYGVTGVTLKAGAGVEVVYDLGSGFLSTGADALAAAKAGISLTGIEAQGQVAVGATAGGGLNYAAEGVGVSGSVAGEAGVIAGARGKIGYGLKNGKLQFGHEAKAGAGFQVGIDTGRSSWTLGSRSTARACLPTTSRLALPYATGSSPWPYRAASRWGLAASRSVLPSPSMWTSGSTKVRPLGGASLRFSRTAPPAGSCGRAISCGRRWPSRIRSSGPNT